MANFKLGAGLHYTIIRRSKNWIDFPKYSRIVFLLSLYVKLFFEYRYGKPKQATEVNIQNQLLGLDLEKEQEEIMCK